MNGMPLARRARVRLAVPASEPVATEGFGVELPATRRLAARMVATDPAAPALAGELAAIGLLHGILHRIAVRLAERDPRAGLGAIARAAAERAGPGASDRVATRFDREFPLAAAGAPSLEELLLVRVANENPAAGPYRWLFDDRPVVAGEAGARLLAAIEAAGADSPGVGPGGETILEVLRAPARAAPTSLAGQLRFIRDRWRGLLGADIDALLDQATLIMGVIDEEERALHQRFGGFTGGPGAPEAPGLGAEDDPERFSADRDWMPRVVLLAKSSYVWLDQLSRQYQRHIHTLDAIPDEELDRLAAWGVTGLWLIGLWQRSRASERIKRMRGNPEAVASAYSLDDYRIADDLGGEAAWATLRERAWSRGIRLASDMVPNHMGIDSRWVVEHPERFLSLPASPYPAYSFTGADLSDDPRASIRIEDHYWDGTDAAVVFQRVDTGSGEARYIYHGNDGTSTPWNDTAQLDYLDPAVREAVIAAILDVARRFPIIRFDAAMTLAKRHIQRLWYPTPGAGGSIPSRAEHAIPREAFEAAMPREFWRDVVDRVAAEAPDTLLLAEAFWLMEGYFVRTLGMHRVYNSAFMHMLRDEDNAGYRKVMRDTLEFDPEILKRYVNFMNNPDEKTAVEQFGKGDKYMGVATVLATLPGLPMLGHGQVEGYAEKYGMEYRRAYHDETPDRDLVGRHERDLFPILHRRRQFAEVRDFLLYDLVRDDGGVDQDVFAYSNGRGDERSLVIFHNRYAETAGRVHRSVAYSEPDGSGGRRRLRRTLAEGWHLGEDPDLLVRARDHATGLEHLWRASDLRKHGLRVELQAYARRILLDVAEVRDDPAGRWSALADTLGGRGVPSIEGTLRAEELGPVHAAVGSLVGDLAVLGLIRDGRAPEPAALTEPLVRAAEAIRASTGVDGEAAAFAEPASRRLARLGQLVEAAMPARRGPGAGPTDPLALVRSAFRDPTHRAIMAGWALLEPMGRLAPAADPARTSRAWYDELLLAPVVAGALGHAGLDEDAASRAAERIGRLLALPRPSTVGVGGASGGADGQVLAEGDDRLAADRARDPDEAADRRPFVSGPAALLDAFLADPDAAALIGLNRWDEVDWVAREGWREALDWALLLDVLDDADPAEALATVLPLVEAGEAGGYRLDAVRQELERAAG